VAGFCEHGNGPFGFIKGGEFFAVTERLSSSQ
jgi:hypothetical protein